MAVLVKHFRKQLLALTAEENSKKHEIKWKVFPNKKQMNIRGLSKFFC